MLLIQRLGQLTTKLFIAMISPLFHLVLNIMLKYSWKFIRTAVLGSQQVTLSMVLDI